MTLGEQIRGAREAKNLSQEELAEYMGVSRQAVSKWENDTAVPRGANRKQLAEFLGLELPQAEAAPQKRHVLAWIGWGLAAVLLISILILFVVMRVDPEEPALQSIRFYNEK